MYRVLKALAAFAAFQIALLGAGSVLAASVPSRTAARLKAGGQARSRMDLDEFMALSRAKATRQ